MNICLKKKKNKKKLQQKIQGNFTGRDQVPISVGPTLGNKKEKINFFLIL